MAGWEVREGNALTRLAEMPDESVQCCVTSPPYFGLRDYGTAEWDGGREDCDHVEREIRTGLGLAAWSAEHASGGGHKAGDVDRIQFRDVCGKCGARSVDHQIGLERSPEEFVARLVEVFREVRRVLRSDGTLWLNIGDSYCAAASGTSNPDRGAGWHGVFKAGTLERREVSRQGNDRRVLPNLKQKDLIGIPWMLAFALRADGWYLRRDVIWGKPNPMPESVKDRPTSAHEYVFLLAKSPRYFYDADAVREAATDTGRENGRDGRPESEQARPPGSNPRTLARLDYSVLGRNKRDVWTVPEDLWSQFLRWLDEQQVELPDVWSVATTPYAAAHFATFPPKLIEPCILAGSSPKACGVCGAPWERVVEREDQGFDGSRYGARAVEATGGAMTGGTARSTLGSSNGKLVGRSVTTGWQASCDHNDDTGRSVILDPFAGAGTTGMVALRHDRSFIGIELKPAYAELARERIRQDAPLMNTASEVVA